MQNYKLRRTFFLDDETANWLEKYASVQCRSVSSVIREALRVYQPSKQPKPIRAVADPMAMDFPLSKEFLIN